MRLSFALLAKADREEPYFAGKNILTTWLGDIIIYSKWIGTTRSALSSLDNQGAFRFLWKNLKSKTLISSQIIPVKFFLKYAACPV
jgi:hypothetical protein